MKKTILLLLLVITTWPLAAQESKLWRDSYNIGVSYGLDLQNKDYGYDSFSATFGYRKFLYWGLFIMPEASLYYQKYDFSKAIDVVGNSTSGRTKEDKFNLHRFGLNLDAMIGVRVNAFDKIGIDLITGPYLGYTFADKYDWGIPEGCYKWEFRWRLGIGISIQDKVSITTSYDFVNNKLYKEPSLYRRGNILSIGIGYTFQCK